jgi:hypothetical protein
VRVHKLFGSPAIPAPGSGIYLNFHIAAIVI